ncbi:hypothetical protein SERLA73DRAFT_159274 [Serpula lacrymans var. lacrymans S7.3]|uniref:FAD-binding PCMH-type domain-containing protein n=2 Tax=Serpula lacrymans var. lacrymans TaxID=341189 RepID=F8PR42_SERL3|nr:uncharacterized protein SERLADRAFT_414222 [Serpula lacrymans var. lacrymans S7.9]EGO02333.1 hypothetical protein SERLA73DRAFT_159274 [Serpula lacrymans var. lacrymans S7.3]EGO28067.1 hypothetical protein SERLADRAFT_414222 [Serpula lacrymans var. lacrymans S7.9]
MFGRSSSCSLFFLALGSRLSYALQPPYAIPNFVSLSDDWPATSQWDILNATLNGRLSALRPWAAVCYTSDLLYNVEECQAVLSGYDNDITREGIASALLWPNFEACGFGNGCPLNYSNPQIINGSTCHQGSTPPYSAEIMSAQDASEVVKWAVQNKVKLTVKNTGHDYLGRSAAPSTLQVHTHSMDTLIYNQSFVPQGSSASPVPALTMGAGAQIYNIYAFAEANNFSAVLGACLTVGAGGGYVQGGGHGLLAPVYGLAADNVLEIEIVTADSTIRIVNANQDPELFWAVRGGGAGSWGIVISVTIQVYPATAVAASILTIAPNISQNLTSQGIDMISLLGKYQNQLVNNGVVASLILSESQYLLSFYWPTAAAPLSILFPFFEDVISRNSSYTVVSNTTSAAMFSSVTEAETQSIGPFYDELNFYGANVRMSSRLVPQTMLTTSENIENIAQAIWQGMEILNQPFGSSPPGVLGSTTPVMIVGDMPAATRTRANETGANPGLYEASWHIIYAAPWTVGASQETNNAIINAIHTATGPLTALGIDTSYQNEGDVLEVEWQQAFFGDKYPALSSIKQKYDPENYFSSWKGVAFVSNLTAYQCLSQS